MCTQHVFTITTWSEQHLHSIWPHGIQSIFSSPISLSLTSSKGFFRQLHMVRTTCVPNKCSITMPFPLHMARTTCAPNRASWHSIKILKPHFTLSNYQPELFHHKCTWSEQHVYPICVHNHHVRWSEQHVHPIGPYQSRFSSPISLSLILVHSLSLNPPHFRFISSSSWHAIKMLKLGEPHFTPSQFMTSFLTPSTTMFLCFWLSPPLAHYHDNMCAP